MIVELSVENLAVIERCDLSLGPGFTALTGETGAGKSLLIDALELVFGARADSTLVRSGASRTLVTTTIDLSQRPDLAAACRDFGAEPEDGLLYLQREVFAEGRSQCRIGGRLAPVAALRDIGRLLVDLHGQHEHQSLLDPRSHLGYLDAWIGDSVSKHLAEIRALFTVWSDLDRRLQTLRTGQREREHRIDLLRYQIGEIEAAGPRLGELSELEARLFRLKHSEAIAGALANVRMALIEGEPAGQELLSASVQSLAEAERLDSTLAQVRVPLEQALLQLEEALSELRAYEDALEASPEALEETAARIDQLKRLLRKYGDDEAALLGFFEAARIELDDLTGAEAGEDDLALRTAAAHDALANGCARLTELRKARAEAFAASVAGQFSDLAMEKARFEVAMHAREPDAEGSDQAEFLFSANVGEELKPLSRIASGGEISRVMLAVKTVLAGRKSVPTLIFDEVDAGLGGRAAAMVARKLSELGAHDQVLAITHLPQIAGAATAHFRIEKHEVGGRTTTSAKALDGPERIEELARMIAGADVGESARLHARELLGMG